jgi:MFS family permease
MKAPSRNTFRSLAYFNFRLWIFGALVSNIGTWMQRIAQVWLILAQLTDHDAAAVGYVTALQFGPQVLLLPWTGSVIDHLERRKILIATQAAMAILAFILGMLVVCHAARTWHVYLLALAQGVVIAFDSTARQTFVADMVGEKDLANAIALNSTVNNVSRMIGPAAAGALIATLGSGWAFLANAVSFVAVLIALAAMRKSELLQMHTRGRRGGFFEGLIYVWTRLELRVVFAMIFLLGTFAFNYSIFISTMAVSVFKVGASGYGLLTSAMAIGAVVGAVLAARLEKPRSSLLVAAAGSLAIGLVVAAFLPTYVGFGICLVLVGVVSQIFTTAGNGFVQMSAEPAVRGRVVALLLVTAQGGLPIGAPLVGWVANLAGPRWGLGVGALSALLAAILGGLYLIACRGAPSGGRLAEEEPKARAGGQGLC